jgi:type IV pilus assembly protein PilB
MTIADTGVMEAAELPSLRASVDQHGRRLHLGTLLTARGLLTATQLEQALVEKERTGERIGEIIVRQGWLSRREIGEALAEQHELEFLDLPRITVDPGAAELLPEALARRYGALPIAFGDESTIVVAVADPTDVVTSDNLRLALGLNIRLVVVEAGDLAQTLDQIYRPQTAITAVDEDARALRGVKAEQDVDDGAATSAPAIALVNSIISRAIAAGASDIHFEPQVRGIVVRARVDGVMRKLATVPPDLQAPALSRLKIMGALDIAERRAPQDGRVSIAFGGRPMDLRIAVLPTTHGEQAVLRILHRSDNRIGLGELGMSEADEAAFVRAINQPHGSILAVGPTGSGKTTTLYAALDVLNDDERVLMTIEDPVEWQIAGPNQIEVNPRSGLTFARGLRTILRSDPDVLLVGEIRDEETAQVAMRAALTGHLVLSTLHAHNAAGAIARLMDMGVDGGLLASAVNCVVGQRLARRLCVDCRAPYAPDAEEHDELGLPEGALLHRPVGCVSCGGTGYRGRVALYEVMLVEGQVRKRIAGSTDEIFAAAVDNGMTTLRQDGLRHCLAGVTAADELRRVLGDRIG